MYDYFYGAESEQFSFYRIPKVLFTEERFKNISAEAKVLYGLLLDRMSLSAKNGWQDKENRVYIIFTIEDIMEAILKVCFLRPKQRPYMTNNFYDLLKRQENLDKEVYAIVHKQSACKKAHKSRAKGDRSGDCTGKKSG